MINNDSNDTLEQAAPPSVAATPQYLAVPDGWRLVPIEPTPEIIAGAAIASWPTASLADIDLARQAAPLVLMQIDMAPGTTVDALAGMLATMAPAYRAILAAAPAAPEQETLAAASTNSFQSRVQPWMIACFGPAISADIEERNHRFLEESLELVQASGCTASEAHQLVDYVFGRPVGELRQEIGGVMVTLAALCLAQNEDMHAAGETELARIWTKVEAIRAKQAAKPKHSPLPAAASQASTSSRSLNEDRADFEQWFATRGYSDSSFSSRDCMLQWSAWLAGASGNYRAPADWKISPMPWGTATAPKVVADELAEIYAFLLGDGLLDGFYFGDADTARPRAAHWWRTNLRAALAAVPVLAQEPAGCKTCDGTGDVHRADGEWLGECKCMAALLGRAEKAEAEVKQVNEWRAAALAENQKLGELWADKAGKAEARAAQLEALLAAAGKLIKAKGRHHTELNYLALVAAYDAAAKGDAAGSTP